jgi:hypothetical protein
VSLELGLAPAAIQAKAWHAKYAPNEPTTALFTSCGVRGFTSKVLFIWLIIRLIQLVFSAETVFFSHKKSANSVFQPAYNSSRTGPNIPFVFSQGYTIFVFHLF